MRNFLLFVLAVTLGVFWARDYVASGKFTAYLDRHPHQRGTATTLYAMAHYYELMNDDAKALPLYQRVVERYPKWEHAIDAEFGVAASYERLKNRPKALEEYQKFLEMYPDSNKYTVIVRNSIDILR